MSDLKVTVIVPRLPPAVDGLGDYSLALARELRNNFGVHSEFIVGDPRWKSIDSVEGFKVNVVSDRKKQQLKKLLPQDPQSIVLLHYVGYGYARRGCPGWLISALEDWKKSDNQRRLFSMMHELFAFGPIWTSQFWTSPIQRNIAKRIIRLSDDTLTSKMTYAEKMVKMSGGRFQSIESMPVFSNIGELEVARPLNLRSPRLIIFGSKGPRQRVYENGVHGLETICRDLGIEEIWDIGAKLEMDLPAINGIIIQTKGILESTEIGKIMADSKIGFFNYPTEYLSKSGIFAAYCAHGMLPVGITWVNQGVDGVVAGEHYWLSDKAGPITPELAGQIAANAHRWYLGHNVTSQAKTYMTKINSLHNKDSHG